MSEVVSWQPGMTLEAVEKATILQAVRFYRGNKTQCSISLGISVRTLDAKLEKYEADGRASEQHLIDERNKRNAILNRMRGIATPTDGSIAPAQNPKTLETGKPLHETSEGVHVQSIAEISSEQSVPVPERLEVQEMLPLKTATSGKHGRR